MLRHSVETQVVGMGVIHGAGILIFVAKHACAIQIEEIFVTLGPGAGTGLHNDPVGPHKVTLIGIVLPGCQDGAFSAGNRRHSDSG